MTYAGINLTSIVSYSNISLESGEVKLMTLNYSYGDNIVEGNYTGKIMIWNSTHLLRYVNVTIELVDGSKFEDILHPEIPVISSPIPISSRPYENQDVLVKVNVTDDKNAIEYVYLVYSIDNCNSWNSIEMTYEDNNCYSTYIPKQTKGTVVYYQIYAFDNESLMKINDNNGNYYSITFHDNPPQNFTMQIVLTVIISSMISIIGTFIYIKKRPKNRKPNQIKPKTKNFGINPF